MFEVFDISYVIFYFKNPIIIINLIHVFNFQDEKIWHCYWHESSNLVNYASQIVHIRLAYIFKPNKLQISIRIQKHKNFQHISQS